ncbi:alkaline phosphatase family protein [Actinomadura monticuli]|uniref:Alkaline phosphatase family protein n=1 Tax=Actinomadura monticuli TaxID=3097367 RepID=A0ABV4Q4K6_9ACTN
MTKTESVRWLVVGLDGASYNVLDPLISDGVVPTIARLAATGRRLGLTAVQPWQTPVNWTSYATGVNPGGHGIYGWWRPSPLTGRMEPASGRDVDLPRFWEIMSAAGHTVGVVNVPMTFPARPVRGFLIAGLDSHFQAPERDPLLSWPPGIPDGLAGEGLAYRVLPELSADSSLDEVLDRWAEVEEVRLAATARLVETHSPEFLQVNLFGTDYVAHRTPAGHPARARAYGVADRFIAGLLELTGPETNVLLVSDHGSADITDLVMIHNVLQDADLLAFLPELAVEQVPHVLGLPPDDPACAALVRRLRTEGARYRRAMYEKWRDAHPGCNVGFSTIDWDRTSAFCVSDYGQVTVNRVRGGGAATSGREVDRVRGLVCEALNALERDGAPLVAQILLREDLYSGRHSQDAPDITPVPVTRDAYWSHAYVFYTSGESRKIVRVADLVDPYRMAAFGDHHETGILIASGPDVVRAAEPSTASILDVAPTLLDRFGVPSPPYFEGVPLADLFGGVRPAPMSGPPAAPDSRMGLQQRLSSLGYHI